MFRSQWFWYDDLYYSEKDKIHIHQGSAIEPRTVAWWQAKKFRNFIFY